MSSAVKGTAQALRGLDEIYKRICGFPAQLAFYEGKPLIWEADEPKGVDMNAPSLRDRTFVGAYGCGKSYILDYTGLVLLCNQPDNLGMFVRKRFEQLKNTTLATFYQILEEATDGDKGKLVADIKDTDGAIEIYLRTMGKPSRAIFRIEPDGSTEFIRDSFKGYELGLYALDETTQLKKITKDTLKTRLRRPGFVLAGLAVSNPARSTHWMTEEIQENENAWVQGEVPQEYIVRARAFDNPYLRADYVEQLKEQFRNDPEGYDMYVLGKDGMDIQGKPVFRRDFNEKVHIDAKLKYSTLFPLYVGLDFGYHNPAAVWFQVDHRSRVNVLAELTPKDTGIDSFADQIQEFNTFHFPHARGNKAPIYYGDPAGAQLTDKGDPTITRLAQRGIRVNYMSSEIMPGIELIRQFLQKSIDGRPRLVIHPRCKRLHEAMRGGYYFRERTDGSYTEKPHKDGTYDHTVDAFRYGMVNLFLKTQGGGFLPPIAEGMTPKKAI